MEQTIRLDPERETITLPLYKGTFGGSPGYYVITESSDKDNANNLGVNTRRSCASLSAHGQCRRLPG